MNRKLETSMKDMAVGITDPAILYIDIISEGLNSICEKASYNCDTIFIHNLNINYHSKKRPQTMSFSEFTILKTDSIWVFDKFVFPNQPLSIETDTINCVLSMNYSLENVEYKNDTFYFKVNNKKIVRE